MSERTLASIQKIVSITPIPDADKIETARVLNWDVVVKKGEFKVDDMVVYIEIDSFVPTEIAPFLTSKGKEPRMYEGISGERLKFVKLRKQVSMGLILPIPKEWRVKEGIDVSKDLGIIKYDVVENSEEKVVTKANPVFKYLMHYKIFRNTIGKIVLSIKSRPKSDFRTDIIPKSDEERIQGLVREFDEWKGTSNWSVTEKLDGQSVTYIVKTKRFLKIFKTKEFIVCSRNLRLKKPDNTSYWKIAKANDLENKMKSLKFDCAIQGEIIGQGIQKNKYKVDGLDLYVYRVRKIDGDNSAYLSDSKIVTFTNSIGLKTVPIVYENFTMPQTIDEIVKMAEGKSKLIEREREGLVFKWNVFPKKSFKAISNKFLEKEDG